MTKIREENSSFKGFYSTVMGRFLFKRKQNVYKKTKCIFYKFSVSLKISFLLCILIVLKKNDIVLYMHICYIDVIFIYIYIYILNLGLASN